MNRDDLIDAMLVRPNAVEWRDRWAVYRGAGIDWREWSLSAGASVRFGREGGAHVHIGPFWCYVSVEREAQPYIDGQRVPGLAIGRL